ncbi:MAG: TOBE domain-containing protein, partial [Nocardioides sp.]|uniref:TOBE domain-containing protein n=1 Tax=Nocardioides sp. TaxID=35761 RepID=UPI0039E6909A
GDRVAVMSAGELQQVATPLELYRRPANLFVAGFIGSPQMNLIASQRPGAVEFAGYTVPTDASLSLPADVTVGIRPESWQVVGPGAPAIELTATLVEHLGSDSYVHGTVAGLETRVVTRSSPKLKVRRGDRLRLGVDPAEVLVFDTATGRRL